MKSLATMVAVLMMILAGGAAWAEQTNYSIGKVGGSELKVGLGPRPVAMGEAFAGQVDDLNATAWNPAGLSQIKGPQVGFMHNIYLQETSMEYLAYAQNLSAGSGLGAYVTYFNYGKMEKLNEVNGMPEAAGEFTPSVLSASVGYGQWLTESLAAGAAVKFINQRIDTANDSAVAGDAGILFKPGLDGLQLGASIQNFGTQLAGSSLPLNLKAGAAYRVPLKIGAGDIWTVLVDANLPFADSKYTSVHAGTEYWYNNLVAVRAGYKVKDQGDLGGVTGLTAGAGFRVAMLSVDYAMLSFGDLGLTHQIAITARWE